MNIIFNNINQTRTLIQLIFHSFLSFDYNQFNQLLNKKIQIISQAKPIIVKILKSKQANKIIAIEFDSYYPRLWQDCNAVIQVPPIALSLIRLKNAPKLTKQVVLQILHRKQLAIIKGKNTDYREISKYLTMKQIYIPSTARNQNYILKILNSSPCFTNFPIKTDTSISQGIIKIEIFVNNSFGNYFQIRINGAGASTNTNPNLQVIKININNLRLAFCKNPLNVRKTFFSVQVFQVFQVLNAIIYSLANK
eukprot:TRINITY_DN10133_c0_g1_i1.p1 TRINITY_DN10133_c0_g1~~TRINITY_DN10133_c0_g1_i1.p1  ORF type:complete len:251 (+),score=11.44 TRINITY_DN10133_c0_g1_i1:68-820(+)